MRLSETRIYKHRATAVLGAVLLLNLITRFLYIRFNSIWCDESYAIWLAMHPLSAIIDIVKSGTDAPFYYLLLHFWVKLFGIGNDAVRTLSIILQTGALFFFFRTCQKMGGLLFAWCASLLVITSPILLHYSLEVRAYPLVVLEVCAAFYLLFAISRQEKFQLLYWLAFTTCNSLMLYTHYLTVLFLPVELLAAVFFFRGDKRMSYFLGSLCLTGVTLLPWLQPILHNLPQAGKTWIPAPGKDEVLGTAYLFAGSTGRLWAFLIFMGLGLVLFILLPRIRRDSFSWQYFFLFLGWAIIPFALDFIVGCFTPVFLSRYILYATFGFFAAVAYAFSSIKLKSVILAFVAFIFAALWYTRLPGNLESLISENWQKAMPEIRKAQREGDLIMICAAYQVSTFAYHYDKDIYRADLKIKELLAPKKIYSVDNKDHVMLVLDREKPNNILLVQSQSGIVDPNNTVDSVLTSLYVKENKETMQGISLTRYHRR